MTGTFINTAIVLSAAVIGTACARGIAPTAGSIVQITAIEPGSVVVDGPVNPQAGVTAGSDTGAGSENLADSRHGRSADAWNGRWVGCMRAGTVVVSPGLTGRDAAARRSPARMMSAPESVDTRIPHVDTLTFDLPGAVNTTSATIDGAIVEGVRITYRYDGRTWQAAMVGSAGGYRLGLARMSGRNSIEPNAAGL